MFGALSYNGERVRCREPIAGEAVVTVGDRLDTWPDVCAQEVHIGKVPGAILGHERLQAATQTRINLTGKHAESSNRRG